LFSKLQRSRGVLLLIPSFLFRAPELFEVPSECVINEKTDVWSLGCTLYALCYGESPSDGTALSAVNPQIKIIEEK